MPFQRDLVEEVIGRPLSELASTPYEDALSIHANGDVLRAVCRLAFMDGLRVGLEKPSTITVPCKSPCNQANVGDDDPSF